MSNILEKCNLSEEEQERIMAEFDGYLDRDEEEKLSEKFVQYCFYDPWGTRNHRECICTHCGAFSVYKDEEPEFFQAHHGDSTYCPNCGQHVYLYALGRMRSGKGLTEYKRAAFIRPAADGGILISAGYGRKEYDPYNLVPTVEWFEKNRTYLAPDKRMQWTMELQSYWNQFYWTGRNQWEPRKTVAEPFNPTMGATMWREGSDGSYYLFGIDNLAKSKLQYCAMDQWYDEAFSGANVYTEEEPCRQAVKYLSKYTAYPLMEMAVKIGMIHAVADLVMDGVKHARALNWSAKKVQDFLRMDKQDANEVLRMGGDIELIEAGRKAVKTGMVKSQREFIHLAAEFGGAQETERLASVAAAAGVRSIRKAANYICKQAGTKKDIGTMLTVWKDYLDAAEKLELNLNEETVRMPPDLRQRHDEATAMVKIQASQLENKKYEKRYKALKNLYEFEYGGLCVIVPENGAQIIAEGKTLRHCVGGYAKRHLEGHVDILFIRRLHKESRSFLTVEMKPRKDTRSPVKRVQIHGYRNEGYSKNAVRPEKKYDWFLDAWETWLRAGSKRDKNGQPIIGTEERTQTA